RSSPGEQMGSLDGMGSIGRIMSNNEHLLPKVIDAVISQDVSAIPSIVSGINLSPQDIQTLIAAGGEISTLVQNVPDIIGWFDGASQEEIIEQVSLIGGYAIHHGSYASMPVDGSGRTAVDYTKEWLSEGVENAISGDVISKSSTTGSVSSDSVSRSSGDEGSDSDSDDSSSNASAP